MEIAEFIAARLNDREQLANTAVQQLALHLLGAEPELIACWDLADRGATGYFVVTRDQHGRHTEVTPIYGPAYGAHIAANDPQFVLADVAAKRRILARHPGATSEDECGGCGAWLDQTWRTPPGALCPELADLAAVWAQHRDYDPVWAATPVEG